ncbi:MAG: hypothetical protein RIF36_03155 [Imperialibacter sp.]|uniref:hypothetical protein n=1 Tax=Imperialibacter sp. TaxID=2038411 RepID=UPI0032EACEBF
MKCFDDVTIVNMRLKQLTALLAFCCLTGAGVLAQDRKKDEKKASELIEQPKRVEFEIKNTNYEDYVVYSCEEEGLSVYHQTEHKNKDGYLWEFIKLDTALDMKWRRELYLPFASRIIGYDYSPGFMYYLIREKQYKQEELLVMRMDLEKGDTTKFNINTVFPVNLTQFEVVGSTILMGGYTNYRPVIIRYNLFDQRPQVVPGFYADYAEILRLETDDRLRTFTVTMSEKTTDKRTTISVRSFSESGDMIRNILLQPDESKSLINGAPAHLEMDRQFIAGTYGHKRSTYSRGLYIATVGSDGQQKIDYYNYADLENFFSYMRAKREQRIKEKISRRKVQGKRVKFNYRLLVHDIIQDGDKYTLYGEAYYPRYSNYSGYERFGGYTYGRSNTYFNPNFLGYKYTHAVVMTFDKSGKLLWDNSFEINDVTSYDLQQFVHVSTSGDEVALLYMFENVIRSKIIKSDEIIEGKTFNDIELTFEDDEVRVSDNEVGGLSVWYGKTFYTYGIQDIKNLKDNRVNLNRNVFFINKVVYR